MIALCIYKPDIALIMMVYFVAYLFLFYICLIKVILICNEGYLYTLSKLSPETIELESVRLCQYFLVFGGPNHQIAAPSATQLFEVNTPEFKEYIIQVKKNARALSNYLIEKGFNLVTGGTDNHLLLIDLKNKGISGGKLEFICELVDISLNKNSVFGDKSALNPGGVRIGTPALTTRGFKESDLKQLEILFVSVLTFVLKFKKNRD